MTMWARRDRQSHVLNIIPGRILTPTNPAPEWTDSPGGSSQKIISTGQAMRSRSCVSNFLAISRAAT